MTYAYILGGIAAWALACVPFLVLARAAGQECPTPTQAAVDARTDRQPRLVWTGKAETAKTA